MLPEFLSLVLRGQPIQSQVKDMRTELAQANISLQQMGDMRVQLPPLPEQQAIAAVLDGVGEAIEWARTERETLQSVKASAADALLTGRVRVSVVGKA